MLNNKFGFKKEVAMHRLVFLAIGVSWLCLNRAGGDDATKAELKDLEGTWKVVRYDASGKPGAKEDFLAKITIVLRGNKALVKHELLGDLFDFRLKLDATKKPRVIDATLGVTTVEFKGGPKQKYTETTAPGIYSVEGMQLKLCFADARVTKELKRPTQFSSTEKPPTLLLILEKKRKAP